MIANNKIAHEWMQEQVKLVKAIPKMEFGTEEFTQALSKINAYNYRLIEVLGKDEFTKQVKLYGDQYDRLHTVK